ncbi:MAG: ABC transporter permease, partial [Acidimicrobiaceae bacterium]
GKFDDIMMRVTDLFLAFPFLVTLLVVRNVLGALPWLRPITGDMSSVRFIIVLFGLFGWMGVARIVRGQVLSLKEREFVEAARAVGASRRYIIARHLLPNSVGPIMVALTFSVVGAIIGESTLAFLATDHKRAMVQHLSEFWSGLQKARCKPDIGGWQCFRA